MYGAHDVRVETVPDARIVASTDALVRVTRACICGSDLWPYNSMAPTATGKSHGPRVHRRRRVDSAPMCDGEKGDLVVAPFAWSDGTCEFCQQGLQTSCLHGGWWGGTELDGGQGEAVRVPMADGTLVALPVGPDHALMPSLLTLSDVMGTGHHAALRASVRPGKVAAIVGDGAVGLCGVIAARRLGAEQIVMLGRHPDRLRWRAGSGRPMSSASGGTPRSSGCAS
jgi:threonine dehydrogenase-like Zn-dependent dehydrogenase